MIAYLRGLSQAAQAAVGAGLLIGLVVAAWWLMLKPRQDLAAERLAHAETRAVHAQTLAALAEGTARVAEKAKAAQEQFQKGVEADEDDLDAALAAAESRGVAAGIAIGRGERVVRPAWRDRDCPAAAGGEGTQPGDRAAGVPADRAEAIGRVLGIGARADVQYEAVMKRLARAQELLDACYEEPHAP